MIIFDSTPLNHGLANMILGWFNIDPIDFIRGPYWAKMLVLSFYIIWNVMPFKILVLVGALQSVNKQYYQAAKLDQASSARMFYRITVPMISPMIAYLIITGFYRWFQRI